jgi:hypothetical protein
MPVSVCGNWLSRLLPGRTAYILANCLRRPVFRNSRAALTIFLLAVISITCAGKAPAQDRRVPASPAELLSYAPIVQPAVINVFATKAGQNRNPLMDDPKQTAVVRNLLLMIARRLPIIPHERLHRFSK